MWSVVLARLKLLFTNLGKWGRNLILVRSWIENNSKYDEQSQSPNVSITAFILKLDGVRESIPAITIAHLEFEQRLRLSPALHRDSRSKRMHVSTTRHGKAQNAEYINGPS